MPVFENSDLDFFKKLVTKAGHMALKTQKKTLKVKRKLDSSIVTQADIQVQDYLVAKIRQKFPEMHFIYEEGFDRDNTDITDDTVSVIIDPIDGTAMYSMYLPIWCISLGIYKGYEPLYGFVFAPSADMLFYNDNNNAYLNDVIITINKQLTIDSETSIFCASEIQKDFRINSSSKCRNLGSTAYQSCLITDNRRNRSLAFIGNSFLWDWAASIPIILKAGGNLRYVSGKELDIKEIIDNKYMLPDYLVAYTIDDFDGVQKIFQRK